MTSSTRLASHLLFAAFASLFLLATSGNAAPANGGWAKDVRQTQIGGFMVGKAAAPVQLVEYVSYTCPHCADFEALEIPKISTGLVANGKANIEIRNFWRDGVDLTVAMLARCGGPAKFFGNHRHLMATQSQWRPRAAQISEATASHFHAEHGTGSYVELDEIVTYMGNVFDEMKLAPIVAPLGITPDAARKCLSDKVALRQILQMTDDAIITYGVLGTPTILYNGTKDEELFDFATIKARIDRG